MSYQYSALILLETMECGGCGIVFAVPQDWKQKKVETHGSFACPNGCSRKFTSKTEAEKIQDQLDREKREAASLRERAVAAERAQQKAERSITRLKKRSAAGVCPCCNRTFKELAEHMKSKHKEFRALVGLEPKKQLQENVL
jgi:hypothetical protein